MRRPDWTEPHRRTDFREKPVPRGRTISGAPVLPENRYLSIAKRDAILPDLLTFQCSIKPVGGDWQLTCRSRAETERLLGFLKVRGIHGFIRKRKSGSA